MIATLDVPPMPLIPSRANGKSTVWTTPLFVSVVAFASLSLSQAHAKCMGLDLNDPDCFPPLSGHVVRLVVDVDGQSQIFGHLSPQLFLDAATHVLTEELRAPASGRESPREDLKVIGETVDDLATFTFASGGAEQPILLILQCSVGEAGDSTKMVANVTCLTTTGNLTLDHGWMTGHQLQRDDPEVALLFSSPHAESPVLRDVLRRSFDEALFALRTQRGIP